MRAELALLVTMSLVGSSTMAEWALAQHVQAPQAAPKAEETSKPVAACGFCLEDGTKVPLILGRELSSGKESTGNRVDFEVTEDIKVGDVVVIPKGSSAYGTIVQAQARRRMGRAGKLDVHIEEVRLADGQRAKLRAVQENKGQGKQGLMTGAMIATGILFFPAAPVFLFMKGKDVVIAKGTPVVSYVDGNTTLERTKFGAMPKAPETVPPVATTPSEVPKTEIPAAAPPADAPTTQPAVPPATSRPQ